MNYFEVLLATVKIAANLIPPPKAPPVDYGEMRRIYEEHHNKVIGAFDNVTGLPARPLTGAKPTEQTPSYVPVSGPESVQPPQPNPEGRKAVATSCIACSRSHMATIAGALEEGIRFAREEGVTSPEAIRRIDAAEKEVVMMERIDLSPEAIENSPDKDRELARYFLPKIRKLRQDIGQITDVDKLEQAASEASILHHEFRLKQMESAGVNLNPLMELAKQVQDGKITLEEARAKAKEFLPPEV